MLPEEVYKRRPNHNNTSESVILIVANYIVFTVALQLFAACAKIGTFFWVVLGTLALYNFFSIRKNREDYGKPQVIAYAVSLAGMILLFILLRSRELTC